MAVYSTLCYSVHVCIIFNCTAPTGSPLNFVAVPAGARNITFTWEVPEPRLQNGVILSYAITCQPSPSSPLGPVSEAGSVTLNGFAPATTYNCSVSASNSVGSGPLTYDAVTTGDDCKNASR